MEVEGWGFIDDLVEDFQDMEVLMGDSFRCLVVGLVVVGEFGEMDFFVALGEDVLWVLLEEAIEFVEDFGLLEVGLLGFVEEVGVGFCLDGDGF
jgi:hypothetical protein